MDFALLQSGEAPRTLYHYTSLEALVSIVQSKRLRASSIRFLNDSSESLWFKQHVLAILQKQTSVRAEHDKIAQIVAEMESWPPQSNFVASFTEHADDLSQWRAYCPPGLGVSIGFTTECLMEQWIANPKGGASFFLSTSLHKVQYYSEANESDLECAITKMLGGDLNAAADSLQEKIVKERDLMHAFDFSPESALLIGNAIATNLAVDRADHERWTRALIPVWTSLISPFFKHHAFESEAEWRKVVSKDHRPMPGQQFRQGKSILIPYVDVELGLKREGAEHVPQTTYFVNEIVVGPTPTPELTVEAVRALFASEGHLEVIVKPSSIPFRSW